MVQHKLLMMRNLPSLLHFSPISLILIPVIYFSTPSSSSEEYAIDQAYVGFHVHMRMCLRELWTDGREPLFLPTDPALIGFGLGTHIPAVLEIHQP